jgi:hypothetical protein
MKSHVASLVSQSGEAAWHLMVRFVSSNVLIPSFSDILGKVRS